MIDRLSQHLQKRRSQGRGGPDGHLHKLRSRGPPVGNCHDLVPVEPSRIPKKSSRQPGERRKRRRLASKFGTERGVGLGPLRSLGSYRASRNGPLGCRRPRVRVLYHSAFQEQSLLLIVDATNGPKKFRVKSGRSRRQTPCDCDYDCDYDWGCDRGREEQ